MSLSSTWTTYCGLIMASNRATRRSTTSLARIGSSETRVSLILLVASAASTTAARAQGLYCKPLDKTGERLLYTAQRQATTPSDSAYRTKIWQIPLLTQSDIALVTDENV